MNFKEVKKDYQELKKKYGLPYDMTGGFVDAEKMEKVILNPTRQNAAQYMVDVISYGLQSGIFYHSELVGKILINDCILLKELKEKYT